MSLVGSPKVCMWSKGKEGLRLEGKEESRRPRDFGPVDTASEKSSISLGVVREGLCCRLSTKSSFCLVVLLLTVKDILRVRDLSSDMPCLNDWVKLE